MIITGVFIGIVMEKGVEMDDLPQFRAVDIVRPDYKNIDVKDIELLDGWIEILDTNKNVVYRKGSPKEFISYYSEKEFHDILNSFSDDYKYFTTSTYFIGEDGEEYICLVKIPEEKINIQIGFNNAPYEINKVFFKVIIMALLLFLVLFIINVSLYSRWMTNKITKPLNRIIQGLEKMSIKKYDTRLDFEAESEFADIRDAFNYMVSELQRIETEKNEIEEKKKNMLVDISHDLKTPITTIQGYSKAIVEGMVEDDNKRDTYLDTIYQKSVKVTNLIDLLFEYVKLDTIDYRLKITSMSLNEFIREVVAGYYEEIEERGFELDLDISQEKIMYDFDSRQIERVLSNLISNTLKYNPNGTTIFISLRKTIDRIEIKIADNGVGIPRELRKVIFEPFVMGDESRGSSGGSGLGLAISKKIIEKHDGELVLEENNGLISFIIRLPLLK